MLLVMIGLAQACAGMPTGNTVTTCPSFPGSTGTIAPAVCDVLNTLQSAGIAPSNVARRSPERFSTPFVRVDPRGYLQLYVHTGEVDPSLLSSLEALDMEIEWVNVGLRMIQGWIPFHRVQEVAALPSVRQVTPPSYASPRG